VVEQAQADMAREGEDPGAVDTDDVFKNLASTLTSLLERLEKMKTGILTVTTLFFLSNSVATCV